MAYVRRRPDEALYYLYTTQLHMDALALAVEKRGGNRRQLINEAIREFCAAEIDLLLRGDYMGVYVRDLRPEFGYESREAAGRRRYAEPGRPAGE